MDQHINQSQEATEETSFLTVRDIPKSLKWKFRVQCMHEGKTLREKLIEVMQQAVDAGKE
jgi:hypothetical protein